MAFAPCCLKGGQVASPDNLAWPGHVYRPARQKLEQLRDAWFAAPDLAGQQRIARGIHFVAI